MQTSIEGLGPLGPLVTPRTRDLCVDGDGRVWVDDGDGFESGDLRLTPADVRFIGVDLVERGGGRVDDAQPIGDAALPGRARVHVVLPPIARGGPLLSIRLPRPEAVVLSDFDFVNAESRAACVAGSVLLTGVTGSGKTTLLSAVIGSLSDATRVVVLEDISEITSSNRHTVYLTTRGVNPDGAGAVELAQLVRESLRMRPEVLVIGEIRGVEFRDYLLALTSGHRGLATVHAGSLADIGARLTALALMSGVPETAIASIVPRAIPTIVHCERIGGRVRVSAGRVDYRDGALRIVPL